MDFQDLPQSFELFPAYKEHLEHDLDIVKNENSTYIIALVTSLTFISSIS